VGELGFGEQDQMDVAHFQRIARVELGGFKF
jgi:hypothetical protein